MGQKINPTSLRIGITKKWPSRWFLKRGLVPRLLEEDEIIRDVIKKKIGQAGIAGVEIERTSTRTHINIKAAKPGFVIGRGGKGIEDLKNELSKDIVKLRKKNNKPLVFNLNINIEELKRSEVSALATAQQIAFDIEKRFPFRTVMRRQLEALKQNREVKGAKIKLSGRLNGAEISRSEWVIHGRMPLQTLRSNIDYGEATSFNTYGTVGIKVWIYKGEVFSEKSSEGKRAGNF